MMKYLTKSNKTWEKYSNSPFHTVISISLLLASFPSPSMLSVPVSLTSSSLLWTTRCLQIINHFTLLPCHQNNNFQLIIITHRVAKNAQNANKIKSSWCILLKSGKSIIVLFYSSLAFMAFLSSFSVAISLLVWSFSFAMYWTCHKKSIKCRGCKPLLITQFHSAAMSKLWCFPWWYSAYSLQYSFLQMADASLEWLPLVAIFTNNCILWDVMPLA